MYLLDTNILSELMRRQPNPQVEARFASEPGELFASAITVEEIRYGARIGPPGNRLWERAEADLFPHLTVLALDQPVGVLAGRMEAEWNPRGLFGRLDCSDGEALRADACHPQRAPL